MTTTDRCGCCGSDDLSPPPFPGRTGETGTTCEDCGARLTVHRGQADWFRHDPKALRQAQAAVDAADRDLDGSHLGDDDR